MGLRLVFLTKCLLAISLSLLAVSLQAGSRVGAAPAVSIIVYDHGLSRQVNYTQRGHFGAVNKTSTFTQDDSVVYAYFTAALSSANVTWLWYDPQGELFLNQTRELSCGVSPCTFVYRFPLWSTSPAVRFGEWTMILQAGGLNLFTEHFSVISVVTQDSYWKFDVESNSPRVHGNLTVTIHPSNGTWSSYRVYLPFAANITAYELPSQHTLDLVVSNKTGEVVVNLGGPRSDGYKFVLSFDLAYGLRGLGGGVFVFNWYESTWGTFGDGYHSVSQSFNISLPAQATFLDISAVNAMTLDLRRMQGSSGSVVGFERALPAGQAFGWAILYHDSSYANSQEVSPTSGNPLEGSLNAVLAQSIPFIPLTFGSLSLWAAVMAVFLLTGSELLAPAYGKTNVVINRRRLRIATLIPVSIFLAVTAYEITLLHAILTQVGR